MSGYNLPNRGVQDIIEMQQQKAASRYIDALKQRLTNLTNRFWGSGQALLEDQFSGKAVPFIYSKLYKTGPVTPVRSGDSGWEGTAPVASLSNYLLPRNDNILVGQEGPFYLCEINAAVHISYSASVDTGIDYILFDRPQSDIFDPVFPNNGGASFIPSFDVSVQYELQLYDKLRNKSLHENNLPMQFIQMEELQNRRLPEKIRFDINTEIEPRVIVIRAPAVHLTGEDYTNSETTYYLNLIFKGYKVLGE